MSTTSYVFIGSFWWKTFFWKNFKFFHHFETLRKSLSAFRQKFFGSFVKIAFYVSIGTFLRKNFNWTNLFLMKPSRTTTGKVWTSSKFFSSGMSKQRLKCPYENFDKTYFSFGKKTVSLSELELFFFRRLSENYRQVCENCNLRVHMVVLSEKEFFWKVFRFFIIFGRWTNDFKPLLVKFWRSSQDCLLSVGTNNWTKNALFVKIL